MTVQEFHTDFRKAFPDLGFPGKYLSEAHFLAGSEPHLDVIHRTAAIEEKHGIIPDGTSTADVVREKYGADAVAFVLRAI